MGPSRFNSNILTCVFDFPLVFLITRTHAHTHPRALSHALTRTRRSCRADNRPTHDRADCPSYRPSYGRTDDGPPYTGADVRPPIDRPPNGGTDSVARESENLHGGRSALRLHP